MEIIKDAKKIAEQVGYDSQSGLHAEALPLPVAENSVPDDSEYF